MINLFGCLGFIESLIAWRAELNEADGAIEHINKEKQKLEGPCIVWGML